MGNHIDPPARGTPQALLYATGYTPPDWDNIIPLRFEDEHPDAFDILVEWCYSPSLRRLSSPGYLDMTRQHCDPYEPCPCGSGTKYKWCHGQR